MIFLVSGRTGAGKTALTKLLASRLGFPRTSFGDAVRSIAVAEQEDPSDKAILQRIGQRLVDNTPEMLCHHVFELIPSNSDSAFVEGLRHERILSLIRIMKGPESVKLLHVELNSVSRIRRLVENRGWSPEQCALYDSDPTEAEIDENLRAEADFVVDNGRSLEEVVDLCFNWVNDCLKLKP